jgi:predicted alpha/beta hydrolase
MTAVQTITITSDDSHRFDATIYPTDDRSAPVLIFLSALGTPAKVYRHFGRELSNRGVNVFTPDWRGIDSSSIRASRSSDFGYRQLVEIDIAATIKAARQQFPLAPIWLGGHSLGGQLSLLAAAAPPSGIAGVVLIASGSVHLPCYQGKFRWGIRLLAALSGITGMLLGYFPGDRIGFGGREAAGVMKDWSHVARTGQYRPAGSDLDYEPLMLSLNIPVLAITFAADTWSPAQAAKALLGKVPRSSVTHLNLAAADTAGVALDHYSWLKRPDLVAPTVATHLLA